jgi:cell cycle protein kinase DBF2
MATNSNVDEFDLPAPPPALQTRGSDMGRPGTPSQEGFTSPQQTPQGSPSKSHQPPGAFDLPHVFENAMKLLPTIGSPSKSKPGTPTSPNKSKLQGAEDADPFRDDVTTLTPGSPTRKSNKENTPPNARPGLQKETSYITHAAQSRQEPYRTQRDDQSQRYYPGPQRLSAEDLEKARKPSVKRLANVTQLCECTHPRCNDMANPAPDFLDYYYDMLTYVHTRQNRLNQFKAQNPPPPATDDAEYNSALTQYLGRERANLRKRRTRLRQGDFQILTQVGQGGYGQVYLAQKKDTKEVCALKVMSKKLLFKLDEIRHVLTERDILTTAKSEWLTRLLYAFQDDRSIYLAMVSIIPCIAPPQLMQQRNTFPEVTSEHC